jgi:hypothetical protein
LVTRQPTFTSNHIHTPRTFKLEQAARQLSPRTAYRTIHGVEHCPVCWMAGLVKRLRYERHHNADALCAVCDTCGFCLVL